MSKILVQSDDNITTITLNNPDKRNAFDAEMSNDVIKALREAEKDKRAVVIQSNISHNIYSAGHDLNDLKSMDDIVNDPMFEMFDTISDLSIPVIAKVSGRVFAGALHMLMVCDMVYALDSSSVVITLNKMGVPFSLKNYNNWLSVMGIHKAKELFFTAGEINAQDAYNAGIFNSIYDSEEALDEKIKSICEQISNCCGYGIANTKLQLNTLSDDVIVSSQSSQKIEKDRNDILHGDELSQRVNKLLDKISHK